MLALVACLWLAAVAAQPTSGYHGGGRMAKRLYNNTATPEGVAGVVMEAGEVLVDGSRLLNQAAGAWRPRSRRLWGCGGGLAVVDEKHTQQRRNARGRCARHHDGAGGGSGQYGSGRLGGVGFVQTFESVAGSWARRGRQEQRTATPQRQKASRALLLCDAATPDGITRVALLVCGEVAGEVSVVELRALTAPVDDTRAGNTTSLQDCLAGTGGHGGKKNIIKRPKNEMETKYQLFKGSRMDEWERVDGRR
ncbi:hypothetical protein DL93DRAFT_2103679 [Clavulina sp. PMI_390]|nr:hypothetical protein DL93DRAFT_2103679 [Clavulina sp. PMI_390]